MQTTMELERLKMNSIPLDEEHRPAMNQEQYDAQYGHQTKKEDHFLVEAGRKIQSTYCSAFSSKRQFLNSFLALMPILDWLPKYPFKSYFAADVVGGLTTGIMHVPQGIAYSVLAGVDPVYGLYASCFPAFFYMFFGTSRHTSLGSFAVVALMAGVANDNVQAKHGGGEVVFNGNGTVDVALDVTPIQIATTLTFTMGLWQILCGVLRLQFLMTYFSDPLVSGFTTGAAVHVLVSQFDDIMGVNVPKTSGAFYIFVRMYDLFCLLPQANWLALVISACSMTFLYVGKEYLSPWVAKKFNSQLPIPYELILVVITAALSPLLSWHNTYDVMVVGDIPAGIPRPEVPNFSIFKDCMIQSVGIAVVTIAIHVSMAKMLAKKFDYKIDVNQELYALGLADMLGSMFPVYPVSTALGRTMVSVKSGTKTQLSTIFSCALLMSIILWLGPLLQQLPKCVLASIIVIALQSMFRKFSEIGKLWPVSRADCLIWVISFLATAFIDVMEGLVISIVVALMSIIFRTQWPRWKFSVNVQSTDPKSPKEPNMAVLRFDSPLLFTNTDRFRSCLMKTMAVWDDEVLPEIVERPNQLTSSYKIVRFLVVDCSAIPYIDYMGIQTLIEVSKDIQAEGIHLYYAAVNHDVQKVMEASKFFDVCSKEYLFPTLRDAIAIARRNSNAMDLLNESQKLDRTSEKSSEVDNGCLTPGSHHSIVKLSPVSTRSPSR